MGLSGADPAGKRHRGLRFQVWLTVYDPDGRKLRRERIGSLEPEERRFFDVTELAVGLPEDRASLCVIHRVPDPLPAEPEFDMYRTMVQLERPGGGSGSVIYETPPRLNAKPGSSFFSFSNQAVLGPRATTILLALHYSVNEGYSERARVRLRMYRPDGACEASESLEIPAFSIGAVDLGPLVAKSSSLIQRSVVVCSPNASLIPLFVNLDERLGGVSVEHTHPPFSYLGMPGPRASQLRRDSIARFSEAG